MQSPSPPMPQRIDRYLIERELGRGGFGAVYRAKHSVIGRTVALKVLLPERATSPNVLERFLREARAIAAIGSPNIVEIYDAGMTESGDAFLAMEILEGEDLQEHLRRLRTVPVERAAEITKDVLSGLGAAHRAGIVHRDMKPGNVFLARLPDGSFRTKVLDFGISKVRSAPGEQLTMTGALLGTPHYMAPEQLMASKEIDGRADLYAVGTMLYELVSGELPYPATSLQALIAAKLDDPPRPLRSVAPHVPEAIAEVVRRALAYDASARFSSAEEMRSAIDIAMAGGRVAAGAAQTIAATTLRPPERAGNAQATTPSPMPFGTPGPTSHPGLTVPQAAAPQATPYGATAYATPAYTTPSGPPASPSAPAYASPSGAPAYASPSHATPHGVVPASTPYGAQTTVGGIVHATVPGSAPGTVASPFMRVFAIVGVVSVVLVLGTLAVGLVGTVAMTVLGYELFSHETPTSTSTVPSPTAPTATNTTPSSGSLAPVPTPSAPPVAVPSPPVAAPPVAVPSVAGPSVSVPSTPAPSTVPSSPSDDVGVRISVEPLGAADYAAPSALATRATPRMERCRTSSPVRQVYQAMFTGSGTLFTLHRYPSGDPTPTDDCVMDALRMSAPAPGATGIVRFTVTLDPR